MEETLPSGHIGNVLKTQAAASPGSGMTKQEDTLVHRAKYSISITDVEKFPAFGDIVVFLKQGENICGGHHRIDSFFSP